MTNSPPVDYLFPATVEEASAQKTRYGERARFIAGGTDLVLLVEAGGPHPEHLIDVTRIPDLHRLEAADGHFTVGAAVTYNDLLGFAPLVETVPFLAKAIHTIGGVQVRNIATLAGNLANASPAGDTLPPLYVLDTTVHVYGPEGARAVPVGDFVLGVRQTALGDGELITHLTWDAPGPGWYGAFEKLGLRRAMAIAVAGLAVLVRVGDDRVEEARVALGSVAPTVIRAQEVENVLTGRVLDDDAVEQAAQRASEAARPIDDVRGSADYRKMVVGGLMRRALRDLRRQMAEEG
jgi:CO/xanthine dehydrogenase FAD-binding subunit